MSDPSKLRLLKNRIKARPPMIRHTSNNNIDVVESEVEDRVVDQWNPTEAHHNGPNSESKEHVEEVDDALDHTSLPVCLPVSAANSVQWLCTACNNECLMVTRESRCICGHRRKEHLSDGEVKASLPCSSKSCTCSNFFYIVGEGSWMLRCQCKHKHIEHSPDRSPFPCKKCKSCAAFDSPWVCNCGHRWNQHAQRLRSARASASPASVPNESAASKINFSVRRDGVLPMADNRR